MDVAHRLGLGSTATMMFGHVETIEDRIEHLERVRAQQDKSKGLPRSSPGRSRPSTPGSRRRRSGAHEYLRTQALSRIYLDNFPSVQSSWVTQGPEIGQVALKFGANDLGSIMIEENVVVAGRHHLSHGRGRHAAADSRIWATNRTSGITGIIWLSRLNNPSAAG